MAKRRDPLVKDLLAAIDEMQDSADIGGGVTADIRNAPEPKQDWRTPWRLISEFAFIDDSASYDDLFLILKNWRDSRRIAGLIGGSRLTRIVVTYKSRKGRGAHGEYTLSGIASWNLAISRAVERVGIRDERLDALVERYGTESDSPSYLQSIVVWFSPYTMKDITVGKPKKKAPQKKKAKGRRRL